MDDEEWTKPYFPRQTRKGWVVPFYTQEQASLCMSQIKADHPDLDLYVTQLGGDWVVAKR